MSEILETLAMLSVLVFVISSMLSMGLSLTTKQIVEPLKDTKLVVLALVANFVTRPHPSPMRSPVALSLE